MNFKYALLALATLLCHSVHAQPEFPSRTVTLVVPYAPGGVTDYLARALAEKLGKRWAQSVIVENRPGGGSIIGTQQVSRAAQDGYTLLFTSYGYTSNNVLRKKLSYSAASFRPIGLLGSSHNVLLVSNSHKGQSLAQIIEQAKAHPETLKLASSGLGSSPHIGAEFFSQLTGIRYTHVPYKGQGPAMSDLRSGLVDGMFDGMSSYAQVRSGNVAAVAIAAEQRHSDAPEIPTFRELGHDFVSGTWFGLLAPAGTPDAVVEKTNADMQAVLQEPELKEQIARTGLRISVGSPEDFGTFLAKEAARLRQLVEQGGQVMLQ